MKESRNIPALLYLISLCVLAFAMSPGSQQTQPPVPVCTAEDSSLNTVLPFKEGVYDFTQVTADGRGFWTVYSVRDMLDGSPGIGNNVTIHLLEIDETTVLMFGSGYGEILFGGLGPIHDAAYDMARVDAVIRGCMGRDPAETDIKFWTPHGHADHIHSAGMRELRLLGYTITDIYYSDADDTAVQAQAGWTAQDLAAFRSTAGPDCITQLWFSDADLGRVWIMRRSGHTSGSVDLVIDVDSSINDRIVLLGSQNSNLCNGSLGGGVRYKLKAHGNIIIP